MAAMMFHDESFPETSFKQLAALQLEGELCDVILCVECLEIAVHKVVMAATSPYFRAMFTGKLMESTRARVVFRDIDPFALEALVRFAYTGALEIVEENVQSLMCAATLLQITSARDACCDFLCDQLEPSNCLGIRSLGDLLSCEKLYETAHKFTVENFLEVMQCEEFLVQPFDSLSSLLESDNLIVYSEQQVLSGFVEWLGYLPTERCGFAFELLKRTNLMRVGADYLAEKLIKQPVIKSNEKCVQLISETIESLRCPCVRAYWEVCADFRKKRAHTKKVLLAIGGECAGMPLSQCECYTIEQGVWKREIETAHNLNQVALAEMHQSRTYAAVAACGGHVYAIGGQSSWKILDIAERYEWSDNQWVEISPVSFPRLGSAAVVHAGKVLVLGGCGKSGYLSTVEGYDPLDDRWELHEPMRSRRSYLGVSSLGGKLYAVGGFGGMCERPDGWLSTVECVDLMGRGCSVLTASMAQPRAYMGLVTSEGTLLSLYT